MNLLPSLETIEDVQKKLESNPGFTEQPTVPIYLPEEDGIMEVYDSIPLPNVQGYPVRWTTNSGSSLESTVIGGSQEVIKATEEGKLNLNEVYVSSKAVYVATPKTHAELINQLDADKVLGIYVDGDLKDFGDDAMEAFAKVGLEKVCTSLESLELRLLLI